LARKYVFTGPRPGRWASSSSRVRQTDPGLRSAEDVLRATLTDLIDAHRVFREHEPRDLFYRVATELVDLSREGRTEITTAEALAVLLQTWNLTYYRFRPTLRPRLIDDLEGLLAEHADSLSRFRGRRIEHLSGIDEPAVAELFQGFEARLGPVGAAKALHLLAPRFFPLW